MHDWNLSLEQARQVQQDLAARVRTTAATTNHFQTLAGIDLAYDKASDLGFCSIIVFSYPNLEIVASKYIHARVEFPYRTGFLSFREAPLILQCLQGFSQLPDLLVFDGQGIAHPRGLGIASHVGVLLNIPTIGCAKSRLIGDYEQPAIEKGSFSYLYYQQKTVGIVLRTKKATRPIFVSPGHLIDLDTSREILMTCAKYRIPEPTRIADIEVKKYKQTILA